MISHNSGSNIFRMSRVNDNTFEIGISFSEDDSAILNVHCFSQGDESHTYVSDRLTLIKKPYISGNLKEIKFSGKPDVIFTNVNSEVYAGLFAFTNDKKVVDISSPLLGSEFIFDNPEIALITESGKIRGLKDGTTNLTARYKNLSTSISVDVGAEIISLEYEDNVSSDNNNENLNSNAPIITTQTLPDGKIGESYQQRFSATGATPIEWRKISGELPRGINIFASTGAIAGVPENSGIFSFTVQAKNDLGYDTREFNILIHGENDNGNNNNNSPNNQDDNLHNDNSNSNQNDKNNNSNDSSGNSGGGGCNSWLGNFFLLLLFLEFAFAMRKF